MLFRKLKTYFKERSPDWLFAFLQMCYWAAHPKYPFIKISRAHGFWVARLRGNRFYFPTPRIGILAHFVGSYRRIYGRYFWVEKDEVVLDVGAYSGSFAVEAAKNAKKVLAIEPDLRTYKCLKRNVSNFANICPVNMGVWNSKAKLNLYVDPKCPLANSIVIPPLINNAVEIEVDTLDQIAEKAGFGAVDFLKINVEGAELEALCGMEKTLRSVKKIVMDAHHVRNGKPTWPSVCKFLEDRGFQTRVDKEIEAVYAWKTGVQLAQ
ncbi:MAG TPA: hypothetical protein DCY27_11630 [Desulfobacterales bacterium]|nr:hypothetical protein [Desulfobacterales bacterium]